MRRLALAAMLPLLPLVLLPIFAHAAEDEEEELALLFSKDTKVSAASKSTEAEDGRVVAVLPIERGRASLAARVTAIGARPGRGEERLSSYVLGDVGVRVNRIWRNLGATASVSNVFDARYAQPAGDEYLPATLPMPSRRVMLEVRWER